MTPLPEIWRTALDRRQALLSNTPCLRILHSEVPRLRCDRFDTVCWGYWYSEQEPGSDLRAHLGALCQAVGVDHWHLHGMSDRGVDPQRRRHWSSPDAPMEWQADEADLRFALHADRGQSPGLFLDQRGNRQWVREHAQDRSVANLFAYTGGFGVAAAAGGATEVEQVDVSRRYLDWAGENARLNDVETSISHTAVDAQLFLAGCGKRGRRFDGIICDPPSFARGRRRGEGAFRIVDDLPVVVASCLDLLTDGGWLLVTSNYEGWTREQMAASLALADARRIEPAPGSGEDFEASDVEPLLKGFLLWR